MIKNILITELENITTRILGVRVIGVEIFKQEKLIKQALFAANDILKECGLNSELWFRERKNKVFLFNEANRRILAELQIDGEYSSKNSIIRKPKIILLGNRGFLKEKMIGDLIESGATIYETQKLLRHSSSKTTETYVHNLQNTLSDVYSRLKNQGIYYKDSIYWSYKDNFKNQEVYYR